MTASSSSKGDFEKKNFKGLLSEEGKKTSDNNMSEGHEFQSATGEEVVSDVEEGSIGGHRQQPSSFEEKKKQEKDLETESRSMTNNLDHSIHESASTTSLRSFAFSITTKS